MKDSIVLEWLDENRRRGYPLKEHINNPAEELILDAVFMTTSDTQVALQSIEIAVDECNITTSEGVFTTALPIIGDSVVVTLETGSKLVVSAAFNLLDVGTTSYTDVYFEDTTAIYYHPLWKGLPSISFVDNTSTEIGPFTGAVNMFGRYNTSFDTKANSLVWAIGGNTGNTGIPLPICSAYGDDACGTQVSYINGIAPVNNVFKITANSGLAISGADHTITLSLLFNPSDICVNIPPTP